MFPDIFAAGAAHPDRNATGLGTALWRCDLGAELPLLAGSSTIGIRPLAEVHDRRLSDGPIE